MNRTAMYIQGNAAVVYGKAVEHLLFSFRQHMLQKHSRNNTGNDNRQDFEGAVSPQAGLARQPLLKFTSLLHFPTSLAHMTD